MNWRDSREKGWNSERKRERTVDKQRRERENVSGKRYQFKTIYFSRERERELCVFLKFNRIIIIIILIIFI